MNTKRMKESRSLHDSDALQNLIIDTMELEIIRQDRIIKVLLTIIILAVGSLLIIAGINLIQ